MKQVYRDDAKGMINSPNRTHEINLEVLKQPKNQEAIEDFLKNVDKEELLKASFLYCSHTDPMIRLLCLCGLAFCNDSFSKLSNQEDIVNFLKNDMEVAKTVKDSKMEYIRKSPYDRSKERGEAMTVANELSGRIKLEEELLKMLGGD